MAEKIGTAVRQQKMCECPEWNRIKSVEGLETAKEIIEGIKDEIELNRNNFFL